MIVRHHAHRLTLGALVAVLAVGGTVGSVGTAATASAAPSATSATAATVTIAVTPTGLLTGDQVTATGTASTAQVRPAVLQRLGDDGAWADVASGSTASGGAYTLTDPVSRTGSYRVVLPAKKVGSVALTALTSATKQVAAATKLDNGRTLTAEQYLTSSNGAYRLTLGTGGNLKLTATADPDTQLWRTGTGGHPGARLVMQYRGNLVLVDPSGAVLWSTGTASTTAYLVLHSKGTLEVTDGTNVLWDRTTGLHTTPPTPTPPTPAPVAATVRGDSWVAAKVKYSQSRYYSNKYGSYRTDCSGFVSMMWALKSSYTTRTLPSVSTVISKASLRTGDILNVPGYHTVLFDKWANTAKTQYWVYEQTPSSGAAHHVIPYPYYAGHRTGDWVARRLDAKKAASVSASRAAVMGEGSDAGPGRTPR